MLIKNLYLTDFRNFKKKELKFSPGMTVIVGPNASGKTNILESLFLLSLGKSFKAKVEEEMIGHDREIARVKSQIETPQTQKILLEAVLTRGLIDVGNAVPEKVARKKLLVNGVSKRLIDFAGLFKATLFGPWDLELVTESPSTRRRFLDTVLSQIDREYRRAVLSYEKGLRQRNKLLFRIREESLPRSQLLFWDRLLIRNGDHISVKREEFIDFVNKEGPLNDQTFELAYEKSAISEGRLEQYAQEEVAAATTLVGPHRDDFAFGTISGHLDKNKHQRDLSSYGSRGEQRMGVLWLKLAELDFVEDKTGERPVLFLDDIFSELDHEHRKTVAGVLNRQQTIISTTDEHFIEGLKKVEKIILKG